jgi:photosystem II stability/assembly factor-like uncharacterized protein
MVDSDKFTSGDEDERDQRLIQDLHHMYHAKVEDAQLLARIRKRLAESSASMLYNSPRTPQQHDVLSMHRERPGNVNSTRAGIAEGRTWQQRTGTIAAVVFVTLLVGSLVVVLTSTHHSSPEEPGNTLQLFGALSSIHMFDAQKGWAVTGKGRIVQTTDGGVHWKDVTPRYPSSGSRQKVVADFLKFSSAWVAVSDTAADGTTTVVVFRTSDGGRTWQDTTIQQTSSISQITFVDAQHGWMLSKQADLASAEAVAILGTNDGGKTWAMVSAALASSIDIPPPGQLPFGGTKTGLGFLDATTGWMTGSSPVNGYLLLYTTHDGGSKWYPQTLQLSPEEASSHLSISPPLFFNTTDGLLPVTFDTENGSSIDFYVTHDGGRTWNRTTPVVASAGIWDFIDMNYGWASDGTHLYVTSDGGHQWTKLSPGANFKNISRLDFVSRDIGWAIGSTANNYPSLLKTVDGGHTWTVIS